MANALRKIGFEVCANARVLFHARLEEPRTPASLRLGAIERQLGALHQHGRISAVLRRQRNADTAAGQDLLPVEDHGREQRIDDQLGSFAGFGCKDIALQHGELVAAQTRQERRLADAVAKALRNDLEIGVADGMALRIVQRLEVVEVDHEQRKPFCAVLGGFLRHLELPHQHGAVGQIGKAVVFRNVGDARFCIARAGDVRAYAAPAAVGRGLCAHRPPGFTRADRDTQDFVAERLPAFQQVLQLMDGLRREQRQKAAAFQFVMRQACRIDEPLRRLGQPALAVDTPKPVGRMRLEIVEQQVGRVLCFLHGGGGELPANFGGMVGRCKTLQRDDAGDQQKRSIERPVIAAEQHAGDRAGSDHQRVTQRSDRKAGVEQRTDAEDRGGKNAEKQRMLFGAESDERGDHGAPQQARQQGVADDPAVLDLRVEQAGGPARLAQADEDQHGAGVAPHEDQRHAGMAPECECQHDRVQQRMDRGERGERMEGLAAGHVERVAMLGGYIDLAEKRRLQIGQSHALSHPQTGQADRCADDIGKTRSIDRQSGP